MPIYCDNCKEYKGLYYCYNCHEYGCLFYEGPDMEDATNHPNVHAKSKPMFPQDAPDSPCPECYSNVSCDCA